MQKYYKSAKKSGPKKTWVIWVGLFVILAIIVLVFMVMRDKQVPLDTGTTQEQSKISNSSQPDQTSPQTSAKSTASTSASGATLKDLDRSTFVSNHSPNLNGVPAPNNEQSVCITTPGANCKVIFTKGSIVRSLPEKTVGQDGSLVWNWTLQQVRLAEGSWQISITASLNGQTKILNDSLPLIVSP